MPITQDRLILMVDVANDLYHKFRSLDERAREIIMQDLRTNPGDLPDDEMRGKAEWYFRLLNELTMMIIRNGVTPEEIEKLAAEKAHFKATSRRNTSNTERMKKLRMRRKIGMADFEEQTGQYTNNPIDDKEKIDRRYNKPLSPRQQEAYERWKREKDHRQQETTQEIIPEPIAESGISSEQQIQIKRWESINDPKRPFKPAEDDSDWVLDDKKEENK